MIRKIIELCQGAGDLKNKLTAVSEGALMHHKGVSHYEC